MPKSANDDEELNEDDDINENELTDEAIDREADMGIFAFFLDAILPKE
jgi:hypothetical protein